MHPISSPSIEGIQLFQSAGQSCMPNNQLQSASTLQSQIDWQKKKKPGWKRASGSGLRWKALLKVNLTLNCFCLFFVHGQREEVRGADRGEVRRTGGEPAPRMQQVDMQRRARPVVSMAQQEQETDRSHTQRGQRSNVYTLVQPQKRCTRTDTHTQRKKVIRQLTAAKVGEAAAQKSARQQLILPMWSLQRQREWRRLENSSASEKTKRLLTDQYICHSAWAHS